MFRQRRRSGPAGVIPIQQIVILVMTETSLCVLDQSVLKELLTVFQPSFTQETRNALTEANSTP